MLTMAIQPQHSGANFPIISMPSNTLDDISSFVGTSYNKRVHTANMSSNAKGAAKSVIRRRISRACDQCNQLRTRCDGLNPCAHCISFNLECKYARERKKRGKASKKDLLLQQQKLQQQQQSQNNQPENQKQDQLQQPLQSQPQQQQSLQPTRISQARKRKRAATIAEVSTEGQFDGKGLDTVMRPMKRNSAVQSSPTPKSPFNYAQPGSHDMRAFSLQQQHGIYPKASWLSLPQKPSNIWNFSDDPLIELANLNIQHGDGMHTFAASAMQPVPVELASLITPQTEHPPSLTESYMIFNTQNQQNLELSPSHAFPLPESHHTWLAATDIPQESHNTLRYPVLLPLLPHISDIMSEDEACDMLDLYFSQPGLLYPTSPYVLTQVIKKASVLHPTTPRTTSAALLASILCIACQTNPNLDEHAGRVDANGRGIMSQKLLGLCIELLRPLVHCSSQPTPDLNSDGVAYGLVSPWPTDCRKDDASSDGSTATLDDVLTYINLALMWSGSDMKHVSLRWWTSAWNLARELRLNREPTAEEGKNVCHSPTDLEPQLITEEVREERRRAWWLLYMVDRQMALCYNRPLAFLDVEAVGMYLPDEGCAGNFSNTSEQIRAGLSIQITGRGMFSCFLPLMNILGGIIELHHARNIARINPIYQTSSLDHLDHRVHELREQLDTYIQRLQEIQSSSTITTPSQAVPSSYSASVQYPRRNLATDIDRTGSTGQSQQYVASFGTYSTPAKEAYVGDFYWEVKLVYCTYFAYVLHIILAGKWDPVELLDDENVWTSSSTVMASASHAISAAEALEKIFRLDPDLRFMPTFFAVYLLHGSMLLLSIADKLQHTNGDGRITRAYQITSRGHEIFATRANTEYQRNLLKYMRIATMQVNGENLHPITDDERLQMRKILKMHRWNGSGVGLAS